MPCRGLILPTVTVLVRLAIAIEDEASKGDRAPPNRQRCWRSNECLPEVESQVMARSPSGMKQDRLTKGVG